MPHTSRETLDAVTELVLDQKPVTEWPDALFQIADNIQRRDILLGHDLNPGDALRAALPRSAGGQFAAPANERSWREEINAAPQRPVATTAYCISPLIAVWGTPPVTPRWIPSNASGPYEKRLKSLDFQPAFDPDGALARARQMIGRDDAGAHLGNE